MKHAIRRLVKDWQFSSGAIIILALGIGANTAVFSLLNNSLFRPHPFTDSERLVNLYQNAAATGVPEGVSYPAFLDLQRETSVFAGVAACLTGGSRYQTVDALGGRSAIRFGGVEYVSANYLDVVGMRPSLGRWFTTGEEHRAEPVAVLGWSVWQRDFAADPNVLGQTLVVGGTPVQVIGVAPVALNSSENNFVVSSIWMPVSRIGPQARDGRSDNHPILENRSALFLQVRARLRDGVTLRQAQAAMDAAAQRFAADYPDSDPKRGIKVLATDDVHVHPRERFLKPIVVIVLGVVGLVLAVACSNLATLLLVRSSARTSEVSLRLALGATRWQLVRHLLMESLVLSAAGAVAGLGIAHSGLRYLATIDLPVVLSLQLDYRVLGFAIATATICGIGFGLTPALQATRVDLAGTLREEKGSAARALSLARGWFTLKNTLVTGQVTASFVLLAGAVLALCILTAAENRSVGYRPTGLAMLEVDPQYAGYDVARGGHALEDLWQRIAALPGVDNAFISTGLPGDAHFDREIIIEGISDRDSFEVEGAWAGPGYFETLEIPILFGRVFDESDSPDSREVAVVNDAFARRFFGTSNAAGKRFRFANAPAEPVEIVGVVGNTRSFAMVAEAPEILFYRSATQARQMPTAVVARASQNEAALVSLMQQEVRRLDPGLPVVSALTMKQRETQELTPFRIAVISLGALAGLGILLASVGLYAVVAYAVAQRTNELGIRIALGAHPSDLTRLVVREVTVLVIAGIVIGSVLCWGAVSVLESSFAQIIGVNPVALAPVALMIVASGAIAAWVPARRAVRTDPLVAIRHQ